MRSWIRLRSNSALAQKKVESELAGRGGGVDGLFQALQGDALNFEPLRPFSQITQGSAQTVETPHDKGIPFPQQLFNLRKARTAGRGTADLIDKYLVATGLYVVRAFRGSIDPNQRLLRCFFWLVLAFG